MGSLLSIGFSDYSGAREYFERSIKANKNFGLAHYDLAVLLQEQSMIERMPKNTTRPR